jgi:hypothetical protein
MIIKEVEDRGKIFKKGKSKDLIEHWNGLIGLISLIRGLK